MDRYMTKAEFDDLEFRDDVEGDYVYGRFYRARAHPTMVFQWRTDQWDRRPPWEGWGVHVAG
jgi:hypothetical protein